MNKDWLDYRIYDWGRSQASSIEEYRENKKLMRSFYITILLPLYVPVQTSKKFHFSVPDEELTCRIFFEDIKEYHKKKNGVKDMRDLLHQVSKYNVAMTEERIEQILSPKKDKKEVEEETKEEKEPTKGTRIK